MFSLNLHQITSLIRSHYYRFSEIKVNFKFFVVRIIHVLLTRTEHKFCTNIISSSVDTDNSSFVFASLHGERFQVNKRKLEWEWTLKKKCGLSTQTKTAVGQINFEVKTLPSFVIEQCGNVSRKCRQHADTVTHTPTKTGSERIFIGGKHEFLHHIRVSKMPFKVLAYNKMTQINTKLCTVLVCDLFTIKFHLAQTKIFGIFHLKSANIFSAALYLSCDARS